MVQQTPKKIPSCKFCGSKEPGERLSSCNKRSKLQGFSTEYTLGLDHDGLQNFVRKIEHGTIFEISTPIPSNIITIGENSKSRHFFVHKAWGKSDDHSSKVNIDDVIFEFSYINKMGEVDTLSNHILGKALYSMLVACNLKRGPFFLYDKTPFKTISNNTDKKIQQNNDSQNNILTAVNNLQKGSCFMSDKTSYKHDVIGSQNGIVSYESFPNFFPHGTNPIMRQNHMNYYDGFYGNSLSQTSTFNQIMTNRTHFYNNNFNSHLSQEYEQQRCSQHEMEDSSDVAEL